MANIFVTRKIPDSGIRLLRKKHKVIVNPTDRVLTKKELIKGVKKADALLCLLTDKVDKDVIKANPNLKIIANYAVGYDNIDVKAATQAGIMVTNAVGHVNQAVAEHTFALMLSVSKRIVEADRFTRQGRYKGWEPMLFLGGHLNGSTIGIVGTGRIGGAVAAMAHGFGMRILYYDVVSNKILEGKAFWNYGRKA